MAALTALMLRDAQLSFTDSQKAAVSGKPTIMVEPAASNYYVKASIPVVTMLEPKKSAVVQAIRNVRRAC
ncbi:MAG: hypothetical protein ACYDAG_17285 [Chloroflexota bacterium]